MNRLAMNPVLKSDPPRLADRVLYHHALPLALAFVLGLLAVERLGIETDTLLAIFSVAAPFSAAVAFAFAEAFFTTNEPTKD